MDFGSTAVTTVCTARGAAELHISHNVMHMGGEAVICSVHMWGNSSALIAVHTCTLCTYAVYLPTVPQICDNTCCVDYTEQPTSQGWGEAQWNWSRSTSKRLHNNLEGHRRNTVIVTGVRGHGWHLRPGRAHEKSDKSSSPNMTGAHGCWHFQTLWINTKMPDIMAGWLSGAA